MTIDLNILLTLLWTVVAVLLIAVLIYTMTFVDGIWNNVLKAFNIIDATEEKFSSLKKKKRK